MFKELIKDFKINLIFIKLRINKFNFTNFFINSVCF